MIAAPGDAEKQAPSVVDVVASVIGPAQLAWKADNGGDDVSCLDMPDAEFAAALIKALGAAGLAVVPVEPTEPMIEAGATGEFYFYGVTTEEIAQECWRAMIAARPF